MTDPSKYQNDYCMRKVGPASYCQSVDDNTKFQVCQNTGSGTSIQIPCAWNCYSGYCYGTRINGETSAPWTKSQSGTCEQNSKSATGDQFKGWKSEEECKNAQW